MKRILLISTAGLAALLLAWLAWPGRETGTAARIETAPIERGGITRIVSSVGSVRALNTVEVGSQLSGQVDELFADFNTQVDAGELLARIDPQTFERRVQEAEANLAVARANVSIQAATITKAEANFKNARSEFERQRSLVEKGSVSRSALDNADAVFQSARADVEIARAQHLNALATVQQREANLEAARIDLERTEIRSPINGVVIDRAVDKGQTVAASLQAPILFTIAQDLTEIQIEASVDEADIGSVRQGAAASFSVDAFPGQEFSGHVAQVRLAPNEEQNVVTYTVAINARNPDRRLLPGMTASIDIVTGERQNVLRVPNSAVRFRPPDSMVSGNAGAPRPGGSGGQRPGGQTAALLEELGVDPAIRENIQADLREAFAGLRSAFRDPTADRSALRERMQDLSTEAMARHLDAAQLERLAALKSERENTREATLYVVADDRLLSPRPVRLGISDDRYTEVVSGPVAEGEQMVTRVRMVSAD